MASNSQNISTKEQDDNKCTVCSKPIEKYVVNDACDHTSICYNCLIRWLAYQKKESILKTCPECRREIRKVTWSDRRLSMDNEERKRLVDRAVSLHDNQELREIFQELQNKESKRAISRREMLVFLSFVEAIFSKCQIKSRGIPIHENVEACIEKIEIFYQQLERIQGNAELATFHESVASVHSQILMLKNGVRIFQSGYLCRTDPESIAALLAAVNHPGTSERISLGAVKDIYENIKIAFRILKNLLAVFEVVVPGLCQNFDAMEDSCNHLLSFLEPRR